MGSHPGDESVGESDGVLFACPVLTPEQGAEKENIAASDSGMSLQRMLNSLLSEE